MKSRAILLLLLLPALVRAEDNNPSHSPASTNAAEAEVTITNNNAPLLQEEVNLSQTAPAENVEFNAPPDSPDPEKSAELSEPLPGETGERPLPAATGEIDLTAQDNNRVVRAKIGNLLRVTLESNPSTGYNWELRDYETGVTEFLRSDLKPSDSGNMLFGAPGSTVFVFQAVKAGDQEIKAVYRRPWEPPDQIAATYSFRLEVAGESAKASPAPAKTPAP
jgi:predicted secreted protein